jgi:hypothetical protein
MKEVQLMEKRMESNSVMPDETERSVIDENISNRYK